MTEEKYSVLICAYRKDDAKELLTALRSMTGQTVLPDEIVLVFDGPVPEALQKAAETVRTEAEAAGIGMQIILRPGHAGLGAALDAGLGYCRNDLVARMDADDISLPDRCAKELQAFREDPDLKILSGAIAEFEEDPGHVVSVRRVPLTEEGIRRQMRHRSPFNHPAVMFRKTEVLRAGGYGTSARKEDHDLFSRMLFGCGSKAGNLPDILLLYRIGKDNISRRKSWKNVQSYFEVMHLNRKRGYVNLFDCILVDISQIFYLIAPEKLVNFLVKHLLRKKQ